MGGGETAQRYGSTSANIETGAETPLLSLILTSLDDDKAEDIVSIDLAGKSEMADNMVIASGRSSRQVAAMADHLADRLKEKLNRRCAIEGKDSADWVLIDCGDVVVHLFRPEVREFYQLEKMWAPELSVPEKAAALT